MAGKTNTELIRDLAQQVNSLMEREIVLRREIDRLDKAIDETNRKLWNLAMVLFAALFGVIGTLLITLLRR